MNCKLSMQSGDQLGVTLSSRRLGAVWGYSWLSYSGSASAVEWLEARDAAEHPTIHRTAPITKDYVTQNVNHAELKKKNSCCIQVNRMPRENQRHTKNTQTLRMFQAKRHQQVFLWERREYIQHCYQIISYIQKMNMVKCTDLPSTLAH